MNRRDIILTSVLLGTVVIGMFVYTYLAGQEQRAALPPEPSVVTIPRTNPTVRIDAKHYYQNGVHTIAGQVDVPTPCDLLQYEATVAESYPEQVTFAFTTLNNSENCAAVVTPQRFMVSATATAAATLQATFNSIPVELNLIEAGVGETPETFELYFKG